MAEEIDKNKDAWTDVTVRDLKQQYVVHLMMDVLNLDRNVNYSNKDELYFFLRRKFGKMVAKKRLFSNQALPVFQLPLRHMTPVHDITLDAMDISI